MEVSIDVAQKSHVKYAYKICQMIEKAAIKRGTGIAKRPPEYIKKKMRNGQAIIALHKEEVVGFCYIESWGHQDFVANSGLIVRPDFRKTGLARKIKRRVFKLSRRKYPHAKIFGITTSRAVMHMNNKLGYKAVPFAELTGDETFWKGCQGCVNYDILQRTNRKYCLCTGMLYTPVSAPKNLINNWLKQLQRIFKTMQNGKTNDE